MRLPMSSSSFLSILLLLALITTAVRADGHCATYYLTESGTSLSTYDIEFDESEEIGTFPGRNPIRDMAVDPTTGLLLGLQGNVPGTATRLVSIDPEDASRETLVNYRGVDIRKMAINSLGEIFVQDNQGIIWNLTPVAVPLGSPGVIASALTFTPDDELYLLQERDPGRFFMWNVNTTDGSAFRINKVTGLGGQRQGAQISFSMSMFWDPIGETILITSFRHPFTRIFSTGVFQVENGLPADKIVPRTRELRNVIAGATICEE